MELHQVPANTRQWLVIYEQDKALHPEYLHYESSRCTWQWLNTLKDKDKIEHEFREYSGYGCPQGGNDQEIYEKQVLASSAWLAQMLIQLPIKNCYLPGEIVYYQKWLTYKLTCWGFSILRKMLPRSSPSAPWTCWRRWGPWGSTCGADHWRWSSGWGLKIEAGT